MTRAERRDRDALLSLAAVVRSHKTMRHVPGWRFRWREYWYAVDMLPYPNEFGVYDAWPEIAESMAYGIGEP